uniref:Ammonium transporter AmtB-like domain-containing protein n=1 Tax=Strombidium rassoulzadegani TaxID=1082188 RepID=A0A7S3CN45_9SPIT|mmetsp:Transcript_17772/g.30095  ORF Transcript_17772/g.30095 Transcript_17772/m.30095 type:complete len:405 (+) Transcript_17772:890-2104(+)
MKTRIKTLRQHYPELQQMRVDQCQLLIKNYDRNWLKPTKKSSKNFIIIGNMLIFPGQIMFYLVTIYFTLHTKGLGIRDNYLAMEKYSPMYVVQQGFIAWSSSTIFSLVTYKFFPLANHPTDKLTIIANSGRAGLVVISGCVMYINTYVSLICGIIGSLTFLKARQLLDKFGIDDPMKNISINGFCGMVGSILSAFIIEERPTSDSNQAIFAVIMHQVGVQLVGILCICAFGTIITYIVLLTFKQYNLMRINQLNEVVGFNLLNFTQMIQVDEDEKFQAERRRFPEPEKQMKLLTELELIANNKSHQKSKSKRAKMRQASATPIGALVLGALMQTPDTRLPHFSKAKNKEESPKNFKNASEYFKSPRPQQESEEHLSRSLMIHSATSAHKKSPLRTLSTNHHNWN